MKGSRVNYRHGKQAIRNDPLSSEILHVLKKNEILNLEKDFRGGTPKKHSCSAFVNNEDGGGCKGFFIFFLCIFYPNNPPA